MWPLWTSKNYIFFHTDIFRNCIRSSVYVRVKDTCWKLSIYYKFTIKELLKLTKGKTWRHSNIVLKLEKITFTNTLKNNMQLGEEINGTNGTKQWHIYIIYMIYDIIYTCIIYIYIYIHINIYMYLFNKTQ